MAVAEEITILIDSKIESAMAGMKKTQDEIGKMGKTTETTAGKMGKAFEGVKGNILAIGASAVAFYESLKKGLEAVDIASNFAEQSEAISKQFGVDSDKVLASLRKATKGMVSDVNLMKLASKTMALGVTDDLETMATLFQYADIQGKTLGRSMEDVFEGISNAVANQNPKFLKQMGVSATTLKQVKDEAGGLMSKTEVLGLVMSEAVPKVKAFGDAGMSTADNLANIRATAENAKLELGKALMPVFDEMVPLIKMVVGAMASGSPAIKALKFGLMALIPVAIGLYAVMGPLGLALAGVSVVAGIVAVRMAKITEEEERLQKKTEEVNTAFAEATGAFKDQDAGLQKIAQTISKMTGTELAQLEQMMKGVPSKYGAMTQSMFDASGRFVRRNGEQYKEMYNLQLALIEKEKVAREKAEKEKKKPYDPTRAEQDASKARMEAEKQAQEYITRREQEGVDSRIVEIRKLLDNVYLSAETRKRLEEERVLIEQDVDDKLLAERKSFLGEVSFAEDRALREQYEKILRTTKAGSKEREEVEKEFARRRDELTKASFQRKVDEAQKIVGSIVQIGQASLEVFKMIAERVNNTVSQTAEEIQRLDQRRAETMASREAEDYETQKAELEKAIAEAEKKKDAVAKADSQRSLARLTQDRTYNLEKARLDKKAQDEEREAKKKNWIMTKAFQVSEAVMNGAQVVLSFAKTLGPVGAIIGGALALAQTVLIATEPMPKFARGGRSGGGLALVGEEGPEIVDLPSGAVVHPAGVSSPYLPYMRENLGATIMNRSESSVTNANKTYNIVVKADDPMAMVSKIRRAFGGDAI